MTTDFTPDFSGDDFAHDKGIQRTRAAEKAYQQMVDDVLAVVEKKLDAEEGSHKNLKGFFMFKSLGATITHSMRSINRSTLLQVSLANYFSAHPVPKSANAGTDQYLFGYLKLNATYPRTYIQRETLREKITDLLLEQDVDFAHARQFSNRFHVITEDNHRLQQLLQWKELDKLAAFPDMEVELHEDACVFRSSRKCISVEEATHFCELAKTLQAVLV